MERNKLSCTLLPLIIIVSAGIIIGTYAVDYQGFYIEYPLFNYYMAPQRVVSLSNASKVFSIDVNNCSCRTACFTSMCQGWSVSKASNGNSECRLNQGSPGSAVLEQHPNSTYFFVQNSACHVTPNFNLNRTFTYPLDMLDEVATGKAVSGSPPFSSSYAASNANDGNDNTIFTTNSMDNVSWVLDLGVTTTILHLKIYPRQDCCHERFHDVQVFISDSLTTDGNFTSYKQMGYYKGPYTLSQGWLLFTCNGARGRYISVTIRSPNQEILAFQTFQAYALKPN